MEDGDLKAFRERWKRELEEKKTNRHVIVNKVEGKSNGCLSNEGNKNRYFEVPINKSVESEDVNTFQRWSGDNSDECNESSHGETKRNASSNEGAATNNFKDQPDYVSIAEGLLVGRTSPLRDIIQIETNRRKRKYDSADGVYQSSPAVPTERKLTRNDTLVEQLIQDLNETNEIPFFDVELPYELALKIFQYLGRIELGRCAQVSKMWKVLAEDEVLWYKVCMKEGFHKGATVSDSPCWKSTLRDCKETQDALRHNWKNRVGTVRHLQYELGKILCDVSSCEDLVIAGYTSGDVRLWNVVHWDTGASYLQPSHVTVEAAAQPHVGHVRVNETVAVAAYEDGAVDVWSTESGQQPVHHYQHLQGVQAVALGSEGAAVVTASGTQVRMDCPVDRGYWATLCQAELQKPVEWLLQVPGRLEAPLALAAAAESAFLLSPGQDPSLLHSVFGHPVTCLDASPSRAALGIKSRGWAMNDGGNKIQVYSLVTCQSEVTVGNSAGDFTCVNMRSGQPHLLVCGNKDRRVRLFDLRSGCTVVSLYAHHLGVTAVQADDWKIVSGGGEGLVCVWETRMGAKLWEMHNRHPVRHVQFGASCLLTANIPDEKTPRGACITDDDLTAHRRHRGVIYLYDFSVDAAVPDHVLPICRSDYIEAAGYNYNIGLTVPYDALTGPRVTL